MEHKVLQVLLKNKVLDGTENFVDILGVDSSGKMMIKHLMAIASGGNEHVQYEGLNFRQIEWVILEKNNYAKIFLKTKPKTDTKRIALPDNQENSEQCLTLSSKAWR